MPVKPFSDVGMTLYLAIVQQIVIYKLQYNVFKCSFLFLAHNLFEIITVLRVLVCVCVCVAASAFFLLKQHIPLTAYIRIALTHYT